MVVVVVMVLVVVVVVVVLDGGGIHSFRTRSADKAENEKKYKQYNAAKKKIASIVLIVTLLVRESLARVTCFTIIESFCEWTTCRVWANCACVIHRNIFHVVRKLSQTLLRRPRRDDERTANGKRRGMLRTLTLVGGWFAGRGGAASCSGVLITAAAAAAAAAARAKRDGRTRDRTRRDGRTRRRNESARVPFTDGKKYEKSRRIRETRKTMYSRGRRLHL